MVKTGIDKAIYKYIQDYSPRPVSTREIAFNLRLAWHTVDRHCLKLKIDGKIDTFIIGKATTWYIKK